MTNHSSRRRPQKAKLGQNFLVSPTAPASIVEALGSLNGVIVVEIGPGRGAITRLLAARSKRVIAIEIDPLLAAKLEADLATAGAKHVEVLRGDVLAADLTRLVPSPSRLAVAGNLPYYITSDILLHLFAHHAAIDRAVLMVQSEVAERIVASPGSRDYGLLSATTQMYAHAEKLFSLRPEAFSPAPQVNSTVVRLTMQPRFDELGVPQQEFLQFLRQAFAQKRKTLANSLRAAGYERDEVEAGLAEAGLDLLVRGEAVCLEDMTRLFHSVKRNRDGAGF